MTDGPIMDAVDAAYDIDPWPEPGSEFEPEFVPEDGWQPEDYPQLTVAPIPYTSSPHPKPDPYLTITPTGWLFMEIGNTRVAIPDEEEWEKLVHMVECMWNTFRRTHPSTLESCVCGSPDTPGVVHRTGGPCYHEAPPFPGEPEMIRYTPTSVEEDMSGDNGPLTSTPPSGVSDETP